MMNKDNLYDKLVEAMKAEPVLGEREFHKSVMDRIEQVGAPSVHKSNRVIKAVAYITGIAALFLIGLFIYENTQNYENINDLDNAVIYPYRVCDKETTLKEKQKIMHALVKEKLNSKEQKKEILIKLINKNNSYENN